MIWLENSSWQLAVIIAVGCLSSSLAAGEVPAPPEIGSDSRADNVPAASLLPTLDPVALLEQLVARYERLAVYRDTTEVTRTVRDEAGTERTVSTQLDCRVSNDKVSIITPASQMWSLFGWKPPFRESAAMRRYRRQYQFWLAPHMAIGFGEQPRDDRGGEARSGIPGATGESPRPLRATEARAITVQDRTMVRLELEENPRSGRGEGKHISLFINPESMLVERVEDEQRLPDGRVQTTRFEITPTMVVDEVGGEPDPTIEEPIDAAGFEEDPDAPETPRNPEVNPGAGLGEEPGEVPGVRVGEEVGYRLW